LNYTRETFHVTQTSLPPIAEYTNYLHKIWNNGWVTNNGELVKELEIQLKHNLEVANIQYVSNGTVALQLAVNSLNLYGKVITTPYSYVATSNAIHWENFKPVFVDIDPITFCIDASKIEEAIDEETVAIVATHVYGYPCDVEAIQTIADQYNLKVIYDGAHAFGVRLNGQSIFNFGDVSTISFHAT